MKLSDLNKRENFKRIFIKSVETSNDFELSTADCKNGVLFFANAKLNIIYPEKLSRTTLRSLTREYSISRSFFKNALQTIYWYFSFFPISTVFFRRKFIFLSSEKINLGEIIFLPGNHSIRMLNLQDNYSYVFSKHGFDPQFTLNDAEVRMKYELPNTPKVFNLNRQSNRYVEERVQGLSIERIVDSNVYNAALRAAYDTIKCLQNCTTQEVLFSSYIDQLIDSLPSDCNDLVPLGRQVAALFSDRAINISMSHGDFQDCNILTNSKHTWVIDWEYCDTRSVWYDPITFKCNTRIARGVSGRLIHFSRQVEVNNLHYILIYILEDLILRNKQEKSESIKVKSLTKFKLEYLEVLGFLANAFDKNSL